MTIITPNISKEKINYFFELSNPGFDQFPKYNNSSDEKIYYKKTSNSGISTFYLDFNAIVPEEIELSIVIGVNREFTKTIGNDDVTTVKILPAYTPIIIQGTPNKTYEFKEYKGILTEENYKPFVDNKLHGTFKTIYAKNINSKYYTIYVFLNGNIVKTTNSAWVNPNGAYLVLNNITKQFI